MAIKIGHASISEKGSVNGTAGDQTGREVCTRTWYSKPWSLVLRCKDSATAERMARACEKGCANNNIGYSQADRNSAHAKARKVGYDLSKIASKCNTDCSAFMTLCAIAAGVSALEYSGNAPTTSNMRARFAATGKFDVLTDKKYLTSDAYLKRGDILVKPGSHTVMALQNGSKVSAAKPAASSQAPAQTPSWAPSQHVQLNYQVGGTYHVACSALNIRTKKASDPVTAIPSGAVIGQKKNGNAVTCRAAAAVGSAIWIYTGLDAKGREQWMCADNGSTAYLV